MLALATTGDKIVSLQLHATRLLDALKARGKVFDSHIYDNAPGGHTFIFGDSPEQAELLPEEFRMAGQISKALIVLAVGATTLAWFAAADQEDPRQTGPLGLIIQYKCLPQHRTQFRQHLEQNLAFFAQRQSDGMLAEYHILFSRYVDTNTWDALALLRFRQYTDVARWRRIEEHSPAALDASALPLAEEIETYPADLMRQAVSETAAPHPVYLVAPYTYSVATPSYLQYLDDYVAPQFAGWMEEGILSGYQVYLQRYTAARPWDSMIFLRYKDDESFGQRENVVAKVRARLQDNPVWKAASDNKQDLRSEKQAVIADELVR